MNSINSKKLFAFTLAEVLITLGIIGVIAAMTLPSVIANYKAVELHTRFMTAYSRIQEALQKLEAEEGIKITSDSYGNQQFRDKFMAQFQGAKDCGYGSGLNHEYLGCLPNPNLIENEEATAVAEYKTYDGNTNVNLGFFDDGQFLMNNGMLILLENQNRGRLYISVDINGYHQRPNRYGHDLFTFMITKDGRLVAGGDPKGDYSNSKSRWCSSSSSDSVNGIACAYYALINKNYFKNLPK